tara:strand:+ start:812 stop:1153 length:342 start_codon:yes stop_codon:yes gene_type:complete
LKEREKMDENTIINFCGEFPEDFTSIDINSDPNFIFENDPEYELVRLFDADGNTVLVNSFLECQHYVKGGWDYLPLQLNESFFHNAFLGFCFVAVVIGFIFSQRSFFKGFKKA